MPKAMELAHRVEAQGSDMDMANQAALEQLLVRPEDKLDKVAS
jgi:hypothetical protein